MKKQPRYKIFDLMYPVKLGVVINSTPDFINGLFDFKEYPVDKELYENSMAITSKCNLKEGNWKVVLIHTDLSTIKPSHIAHEVTHAALIIYKEIGASHDEYNNEPFCYLVEHLYKLVEQVVKNK